MHAVTRIRFILVLLLAVSMTAALNSFGQPPQTSQTKPTITLTEKDTGATLQMRVGQTLLIQLPANPTTGYTWTVNGSVAPLTKSGKTNYAANSSAMGAGGTQSLTFYAENTGTATITLDYRRPWENDPPAKTFTVTFTVIPCEKKSE
jgi:inhibitor of cysteine peptidase